jgi:superfamily I DNA/RNA helicase
MADNSWWLDPKDLDQKQRDAVELSPESNHLVVGPPGSGKTNLLLLRASFLVSLKKPDIAVLVFTRSLREFVLRGSKYYAVSPGKIRTIMKWGTDLLQEYGPIDDLPSTFEERRTEVTKRLHALLDAHPQLERHLEYILVDEVQDCLPAEIDLFFRMARYVFFVGDERQSIYRPMDLFALVGNRAQVLSLVHHYRNGREICKAADAIGSTFGAEAILPTCNYDEVRAPSRVTFAKFGKEDDQVAQIVQDLTQQLKAYPDELLGVACPLNEDVDRMKAALEASPLQPFLMAKGDLSPTDPQRRIYLCTLHDVKGLEFRALHLASMQNIPMLRNVQKRVAFTSVTRAKTSLSVLYCGNIPGYLEKARAAVEPPSNPPALKDLFVRRD